METRLVYGPRRIGVRRQLSVPRSLLYAASISVPGRIIFEEVGGAVVLRSADSRTGTGQMMSKVGQVVTPDWVMQTLGVRVGEVVYARAGDAGSVELLPGSGVHVEREVAS